MAFAPPCIICYCLMPGSSLQAADIPAGAATTSGSTKLSSEVPAVPSRRSVTEALPAVDLAAAASSRSAASKSKDPGQQAASHAELQSLAQQHSPVQTVHQEEAGDVDIANDFGPVLDFPQDSAENADTDANAEAATKTAAGDAEAAPSAAIAAKSAKRSHSEAFAEAAELGAKAEGKEAPQAAARSQGNAAAAAAEAAASEGGKAAGLEGAKAAAPPADGGAGGPAAPPRKSPADIHYRSAGVLLHSNCSCTPSSYVV